MSDKNNPSAARRFAERHLFAGFARYYPLIIKKRSPTEKPISVGDEFTKIRGTTHD